jgi:hypothetical protein
MIGVDLFPLQASSPLQVFIQLSIHFVKIIFQLSIFTKTVVMSFICFINILPVTKTRFVMTHLLRKKAFAINIMSC